MEWISLIEARPVCYQEGDWDGKKSDLIIIGNIDSVFATMGYAYEGIMDGSKFIDFYEAHSGMEVVFKVTHWIYVPEFYKICGKQLMN